MLRDGNQVVDFLADQVVVVLAHLRNADLLVEGGLGGLLVVEHLLKKLLALTQARVFYLHILRSREVNHALGQIGDPNGAPHIEDEDLAAVALRSGL